MLHMLRLKRVCDESDEDLSPNKKPSEGFAIIIKLVQSVEIALAMFVIYTQPQCAKNASIWNRTIFLGAFMQGSSRGVQLISLGISIKLDKNAQFFNQIFALLSSNSFIK